MTNIKYKCSKRLKIGHINFDMEKDVNFNIVPGFLCFCPIFYLLKYTRKTPKMDFVLVAFGSP
jgi:hypothetical protein